MIGAAIRQLGCLESNGLRKIDVIFNERQYLWPRSGTAEAAEFLPIIKENHRWEAPHPVMPRKFHVFSPIHFKLGQSYSAIKIG